MVGLAPGCGDSAVGERAALVAGGEGEALGGGEEPGFAAEVQDFAVGAQEGGDDVGVAGCFAQAVLRRVAAATGPVKAKVPVPVALPAAGAVGVPVPASGRPAVAGSVVPAGVVGVSGKMSW